MLPVFATPTTTAHTHTHTHTHTRTHTHTHLCRRMRTRGPPPTRLMLRWAPTLRRRCRRTRTRASPPCGLGISVCAPGANRGKGGGGGEEGSGAAARRSSGVVHSEERGLMTVAIGDGALSLPATPPPLPLLPFVHWRCHQSSPSLVCVCVWAFPNATGVPDSGHGAGRPGLCPPDQSPCRSTGDRNRAHLPRRP